MCNNLKITQISINFINHMSFKKNHTTTLINEFINTSNKINVKVKTPKMNLSKFSVDLTKIISLPARYFSKDYYSAIPKHVTATLIGAATPVGRMTSLLLKQNRYIDELRLYDKTEDACGVALDLSHIDTNTKVKGYAGLQVLPEAIKVPRISLINPLHK